MLSADCHILVLEDDPAISGLIVASLHEAGFSNVRSSASIAGARQCWHAQLGKFDVFVTDFSLPDGCAPDFIQELRRYNPRLTVILMTGFSIDALELEGGLSRDLQILQKPFRPGELVDVVRTSAAEKKNASRP